MGYSSTHPLSEVSLSPSPFSRLCGYADREFFAADSAAGLYPPSAYYLALTAVETAVSNGVLICRVL